MRNSYWPNGSRRYTGGEFIEPSKTTFREFSNTWVEKYAETSVRPSTLTLYRGFFKNHLLPAFGDMEIAKIDAEDIQAFKADRLKRGKKIKQRTEDGEEIVEAPLSAQSVKHLLRLLRQMFDHAIDWGYLRTNPAKKVRIPTVPKQEMDYLTPEEVRVFLQHVPEKWYPLMLTAITTGLRIGELLAMRWGNLDWRWGQYFVRETWLRPRGGRKAAFAEPKTESSIAPVDLTPTCLDALRVHRKRQAEGKLAAGEKYQDQDLIFATATGGPLEDKNVIRRVFEPALRDAGLRIVRFHDLRHTCASILIAQGETPKYIQRQLRHASSQITFDRYGHLFPEANRAAARRMDETLFGAQPTIDKTRPI